MPLWMWIEARRRWHCAGQSLVGLGTLVGAHDGRFGACDPRAARARARSCSCSRSRGPPAPACLSKGLPGRRFARHWLPITPSFAGSLFLSLPLSPSSASRLAWLAHDSDQRVVRPSALQACHNRPSSQPATHDLSRLLPRAPYSLRVNVGAGGGGREGVLGLPGLALRYPAVATRRVPLYPPPRSGAQVGGARSSLSLSRARPSPWRSTERRAQHIEQEVRPSVFLAWPGCQPADAPPRALRNPWRVRVRQLSFPFALLFITSCGAAPAPALAPALPPPLSWPGLRLPRWDQGRAGRGPSSGHGRVSDAWMHACARGGTRRHRASLVQCKRAEPHTRSA